MTRQTLSSIPSGESGVRVTLDYMRRYVIEYKIHPTIRELSLRLVRHLPQKDYTGEIRALWQYVKERVRYVHDINDVETLQTPLKTLEYGQGDCDDKVTLLASMLESLGFRTQLRAVGFRPNSYCHVLLDVWHEGKWLALETTEPVEMGWTPPAVLNEMTNENLGDLFSAARKLVGRIDKKIVRPILKSKPIQAIAKVVASVPSPFQVVGAAVAVAGSKQIANDKAFKAKQEQKKLDAEQAVLDAEAQETQAQITALQSDYDTLNPNFVSPTYIKPAYNNPVNNAARPVYYNVAPKTGLMSTPIVLTIGAGLLITALIIAHGRK